MIQQILDVGCCIPEVINCGYYVAGFDSSASQILRTIVGFFYKTHNTILHMFFKLNLSLGWGCFVIRH